MTMKFKPKPEEPVYTSELYYDLFEGGYIQPDEMLEHEGDWQEVYDAMVVINTFIDLAKGAGHLEVT